ncbi:unnamed protein product [Urochloa decumbens]|uniref:Acidic protein n=1 Tax=Urochloa decumbens TaxID=240449 RepID=A0ABC9GBG8_9POAL
MGSKGLNGVLIMCVLLLGLVLEQAQVEGMSCCKKLLQHLQLCGHAPEHLCKPMWLYKESDKVEYCNIGCRSLMCDSMDNVGRAEDVKIIAERCGYTCDNFCNGVAINTPVVD